VDRARFAGSAGNSGIGNGAGGGQLSLSAQNLLLNGSITANGNSGDVTWAGAGGGIHLDVLSLSGVGLIEASGGTSNGSSFGTGGGGRISVYADTDSAFSGTMIANGGVDGINVAGAGTIYKRLNGLPHLVIDNDGSAAASGSTPLRTVGRHTIADAAQVSPGVWQIRVTSTPWQATDVNYDWGIAGLNVDLDASETSSSHYYVTENTTDTLTVYTSDDLSLVIGNELVGVHNYETVHVVNGAQLTLGDDRLIVNDTANSNIDAASSVTAEGGSYVLP
jgi:hypothetical protein